MTTDQPERNRSVSSQPQSETSGRRNSEASLAAAFDLLAHARDLAVDGEHPGQEWAAEALAWMRALAISSPEATQ